MGRVAIHFPYALHLAATVATERAWDALQAGAAAHLLQLPAARPWQGRVLNIMHLLRGQARVC